MGWTEPKTLEYQGSHVFVGSRCMHNGQDFVCEIGEEEALKFITNVLFNEQRTLHLTVYELVGKRASLALCDCKSDECLACFIVKSNILPKRHSREQYLCRSAVIFLKLHQLLFPSL